ELRTYRGHDAPASSVAFFPPDAGPERFLSAGADGVVRMWETPRDQECVELVGHPGPTSAVAFSPDRPLLASVCRKEAKVRLWDPETGRQVGDPLSAKAELLAFGPGGLLATAGGESLDKPGELLVWDTSTGTVRHTLVGHKLFVNALAFSPNG